MPDEFAAAADGVPPLFPEHAPAPRHRVKGHTRMLPPKHGDVDQPLLDLGPGFDPEPRPRVIEVKPHHRRNPRRKDPDDRDRPDDVPTV